MSQNWLTVEDAAGLIQVPIELIQKWMDEERIPFFKFYEGTVPLIPLSGFQMVLRSDEEMTKEIEALGEEE